MGRQAILIAMVALGCAGGLASAASLVVSNASFESPVVTPGNFNTAAPPPGWTNVGTINFGWRSIGVVNPASTILYVEPVPHGTNIGVTFLGPTFSNSPSGLHQTLGATLQARTAYALTVAVGNMARETNFPHSQYNFTGFPGYRVELRAGDYVLAADHNTLLPGEGRFLTTTVRVTTASTHTNLGLPLGIRLLNLDAAPGIEVNFDDVRLDATPLPDPVVTIDRTTNGAAVVGFTETLQMSDDLTVWSNIVPQPVSPWTTSPPHALKFFRAAE